jgi:molecular chaperone GrpE
MTEPNRKIRIQIPIEAEPDEVEAAAFADDDETFEIDADDLEVIDLDEHARSAAEDLERDSKADEPVTDAPAAAAEEPARQVETTAPPAETPSRIYELLNEIRQRSEATEKLLAEKNDLYDRLLRKQAEFENYRKRTEREMQEAYGRARADLVHDLLPVLDNIELALHHSESASAQVLHEGVELIHKQLIDTLSRIGLETVPAAGQPFDPQVHEAVATEENAEVEDHTVIEEFQRGYKLGEKLLRPARVKVAVQP